MGEVIKRFEDHGFQIRGCKMFGASPEVLKDHYAHLLDKAFFPQLEAFMQSTPVIALALAGDDAVNRVRRNYWSHPTRERLKREPCAAIWASM